MRANVEVTLPLFCLTYESWTRNLLLIESHILKFFSKTKGLKVDDKLNDILTIVFWPSDVKSINRD